eukprot:2803435-Alexandrium_andersonii.AAC.1
MRCDAGQGRAARFAQLTDTTEHSSIPAEPRASRSSTHSTGWRRLCALSPPEARGEHLGQHRR